MPVKKSRLSGLIEKALFSLISFLSMLTVKYLDNLNEKITKLSTDIQVMSQAQEAHIAEGKVIKADIFNKFLKIEDTIYAHSQTIDRYKLRKEPAYERGRD